MSARALRAEGMVGTRLASLPSVEVAKAVAILRAQGLGPRHRRPPSTDSHPQADARS